MARRIHLRRVPDLMLGSLINSAKTKQQKLALRKSIELTGGKSQFNEILRNNSPSLYLVDPELIAVSVINAILTEDSKYVEVIYTDEGPLSSGNKEYIQEFKKASKSIKNLVKPLEKAIKAGLEKDFKTITLEQLNATIEPVYQTLIADLTRAEQTRKTYRAYQYAAAKAGAELRRKLNALKIAILGDASSMVSNLGNRIPFVSYSFTAGVYNINESIQKSVQEVLTQSGILKTTDIFKVGNLVHAGHVGIYQDKNLLGINMPAATIGGLVSKKFDEIERAIGAIPIHIENGIKLTTNYTQKAGMFLDLQFNFAVSMPAELNSAILSPQEVAAVKAIVSSVATKAIEEAVKEQLSEGTITSIIADYGPEFAASPTMVEYYENAIAAVYMGKTYPAQKKTATTKKDKLIGTLTTKPVQKTPKVKVSATRPNIPAIARELAAKGSNLLSLQNLLNGNLYEQIKRNMGKGERRDVLNFRTGRFARSAEVVRLTMSREGMITAFYNYMKNPYATFSDGGRQQYPKSRDPKLLIAKSIREIAAKEVANRLRAVVV